MTGYKNLEAWKKAMLAIIPLIEENLKILNGLINRYGREDLT